MSLADFGYEPDHKFGRDDEIPQRLQRKLLKAPLVDLELISNRSRQSPVLNAGEIEVLVYASHGLTLPMVADALGLSCATVKDRMQSARFKLRAKNQAHAVAKALRQGLIR